MPYVVRRIEYANGRRLPASVAVASHGTRAKAEADAARRTATVRKRANPFGYAAGVFYLSDFPEHVFCDYLQDAGLTPPAVRPDGSRDWMRWWQHGAKEFTPEQRELVWQACHKLQLFEVVQTPKAVLFAVSAIHWHYSDYPWDADPEGGTVTKLFRTREKAEEEVARLDAHSGYRDEPFERKGIRGTPDLNREQRYEVVEVEWEGTL